MKITCHGIIKKCKYYFENQYRFPRLVIKEHEKGHESTRGEEKRRSKWLTNNHKFTMPSKPFNLRIFTMCIVKIPNHQSLNVNGGWWGSLLFLVMRVWGFSTNIEECERHHLLRYSNQVFSCAPSSCN